MESEDEKKSKTTFVGLWKCQQEAISQIFSNSDEIIKICVFEKFSLLSVSP